MAKLRVRFVLNKGRRGAPLGKLGLVAEQIEKFLRALTVECGVQARPGEWVAADFENHSVQFDAEFQGAVDAGMAQVFENRLEFLSDYDPERGGLNGVVRENTALEYAKIGQLIDPDEEIGLGILPFRGGNPKWRTITYFKSERIKLQIETPIPAHGSFQGIIHAWFKEARNPYVQFRELVTGQLIRVEYSNLQYDKIARAVRDRNMVLTIAGDCTYDPATRSVLRLKLDRIADTNSISTEEFDKLFGSFPDFQSDEVWEEALQ